ncbi:MAG: hypothetical protein SNJ60_05105 [Pseudanabaenaceae cyanobacterium]
MTRQRFRALMVALAHFFPLPELEHGVESLSQSAEMSWQGLLWGLYAEPLELSGWAASVGQWERSGNMALLGTVGLFCHHARYRWEIVTTGEYPWLGGAIAAWVTGEIPQDPLDMATLRQSISLGDRLYRRWAGLDTGNNTAKEAAAVFYPSGWD